MSVTYVIKFQIVPGKYDDFLALLTGVLDAMRHESTFVEAMLHADPDDANRLMLYETWQDHNDVVNVQVHRLARPSVLGGTNDGNRCAGTSRWRADLVGRLRSTGMGADARRAARHLDLALPARRPRHKMN